MAVSNATYKVGDTYTSQKSKVVGTITEIVPTNKNTVRVKLDVNGLIICLNIKLTIFLICFIVGRLVALLLVQ